MLGVLSIGVLKFLSNYLLCLHKSRLCNEKKAVDTCKFELTGVSVTKIMKTFLEIYSMPNFPKLSDTKFRVSLKTVKLTRLST